MIGVLDIILIVLFAVVAPLFVYVTAKKNNHKPVYWALIALAVGVAFQVVLPFIVGIILAVVLVSQGTSPNAVEETIKGYWLTISIPCLILSVAGVFLVIRRVSKVNRAELAAPTDSTEN